MIQADWNLQIQVDDKLRIQADFDHHLVIHWDKDNQSSQVKEIACLSKGELTGKLFVDCLLMEAQITVVVVVGESARNRSRKEEDVDER